MLLIDESNVDDNLKLSESFVKTKSKSKSKSTTINLSVIAPFQPSPSPSSSSRQINRFNHQSAQNQQRISPSSTLETLQDQHHLIASRPIDDTDLDKFNPQHLLLPLSNVSKLMKYSLPADAKVSNQSKLLIQSCVSEFCNFLGSHSNSNVIRNDRKTINGVDLIFSLKELGFDGYHQCLQIYLVKYRNVINELGKRQRKTTSKATTGEVEDLEELEEEEVEEEEEEQNNDDYGYDDDGDQEEEEGQDGKVRRVRVRKNLNRDLNDDDESIKPDKKRRKKTTTTILNS